MLILVISTVFNKEWKQGEGPSLMQRLKKTHRAAVVVLVIIGLSASIWGVTALLSDDEVDDELLFDRFWITSVPERDTDFTHDLFVSRDYELGLFARFSNYRLEEELFEWERNGDQLRLRFPQEDRRASSSWQISRCDELPNFDLCLDLDENPWGGPRRYYGTSDDGDEEEGTALLNRLRTPRHPR